MKSVESLFKSRIYINYLNNIKEHSEIEKNIENSIIKAFNIVHDGMFFYKTTFYTYELTKMNCYFNLYSGSTSYLFTKEISFYKSIDGFWIKKVTHYVSM